MSKVIGIYAFEFDWVEFGVDVAAAIEAAGVNQKQLAHWAGCTPSAISAIVTGARESSYTMASFVTICNVCDLHPGDYFTLKSGRLGAIETE